MPSPDPVPQRGAQFIGEHLATINLFREESGELHLTVADGHGAIAAAKRAGERRNPMNIMADWLLEAGPRFVGDWQHWQRG